MMYGGRFNAQDSLKMRVVDALYKGKEDLLPYIHKWAKEYASKGAFREALKDMK
jgi:enoyl-CoA hydratase/carnithine racemase